MSEQKGAVLITGGTRGIGAAVAERMAKAGYPLFLTYSTDDEAAEEIKTRCLTLGAPTCTTIKADSADPKSVREIADAIEERDVSLSGIVLNAGLTYRKKFEEMEYDEWSRMFAANVHTPTFLVQALCSRIKRGGAVIFTGSMMAVCPHATSLSYGVTKSAVHALAQNLVKHLEPYGVRAAAVAPGFVDTDWQKEKPQEIRQNIERKVALHRFADPSEIADAYLFLLENGYVNGSILTVSGGYAYA